MLFYAHVGTCNLDVQEFQVVVPLLVVQPCFRWWFPFWRYSRARNKVNNWWIDVPTFGLYYLSIVNLDGTCMCLILVTVNLGCMELHVLVVVRLTDWCLILVRWLIVMYAIYVWTNANDKYSYVIWSYLVWLGFMELWLVTYEFVIPVIFIMFC